MSSATDDNENWDDVEWNSETDNTPLLYKPFFAAIHFSTYQEAFDHDTHFTNGAFRFLNIVRSFKLETYSIIQLINYLRSLEEDLEKGLQFLSELDHMQTEQRIWEDETYLIPVIPNDPFLSLDYEQLIQDGAHGESSVKMERDPESDRLRVENVNLRQELEWLKLNAGDREDILSILETGSGGNPPAPVSDSNGQSQRDRADRLYFSSYNSDSIHQEMLSDKVRTDAYVKAIEGRDGYSVRGKTILDVGCGTGILTLLCCRAGAEHVYAVDASDWAAKMTRYNVQANHFQDRVTVYHGKIEEITDGIPQVDVIVSEWMGYALLFEFMLDSVLVARNRWLKPDGDLLPDGAKLYMAGASQQALGIDFWKDVYGFSMGAVAKDIINRAQTIPRVETVKAEWILTESVLIKEFKLREMDMVDVDFTTKVTLKRGSVVDSSTSVACIVLWFEVTFDQTCPRVTIDTSPFSAETHWHQTILSLEKPITGIPTGSITFYRGPLNRALSICVSVADELASRSGSQYFTMNVG